LLLRSGSLITHLFSRSPFPLFPVGCGLEELGLRGLPVPFALSSRIATPRLGVVPFCWFFMVERPRVGMTSLHRDASCLMNEFPPPVLLGARPDLASLAFCIGFFSAVFPLHLFSLCPGFVGAGALPA